MSHFYATLHLKSPMECMMPTFYDSIELEDIDINDKDARFYIIKLPPDNDYLFNRYKICATIQDLDSPNMKGDPESRIKQYWPITKEQLNCVIRNNGKLNILFPVDDSNKRKLRTQPFKLDELNNVFASNSPFMSDGFSFDPGSIPQRTFGISLDHDVAYQNKYDAHLTELQRRHYDIEDRKNTAKVLGMPYSPDETGAPGGGRIDSSTYNKAPEELMQQATATGFFSASELSAIKTLLQIKTCSNALRQGTISFADFRDLGSDKISKLGQSILGNQIVIDAIQRGVFEIQDFREINNNVIPKLGLYALRHENCINAIESGRTTIKALSEIAHDSNALRQAVESDDYPPPSSAGPNYNKR